MMYYWIPILILLIFSQAVFTQDFTIEEIKLLSSTRQEIEKKLGAGKGYCKCNYELPDKKEISITYSTKRCDEGWNVPVGTVLEYKVSSTTEKNLEDFNLDSDKYYSIAYDDLSSIHMNIKKGIGYYVDINYTTRSVRYFPSSLEVSKSKYRCRGFPDYNPMNDIYPRASEFTPENFEHDLSKIIVILSQLVELKNYKAYIMFYFSNYTPKHIESNYVHEIEKFIKNEFSSNLSRDISKDVYVDKYCDVNRKSVVEIYILPEDLPKPTQRWF